MDKTPRGPGASATERWVSPKSSVHGARRLNKLLERTNNATLGWYSDSADPYFRDQGFRLHEDAIEFAKNVLKQHRFVLLLESGVYRNRGGKRLTGWIYYWWFPAVTKTDWGQCPDAGWGRPLGRSSLVEYQPRLYKPKSLAHLNVRASPTGKTVEVSSSQTPPPVLARSIPQNGRTVPG